jgi:hypothetical protein
MTALLEAAASVWDWLTVPVDSRDDGGALRFVMEMVSRLNH